MDGFFSDVKGQFFGNLYSTNQNGSTYLMIKPDGNIYPCYGGFALCEKSLMKDSRMCIDSRNLQTNINVNTSSAINIWSRNSAPICIEYCRGWSNQSYAVLSNRICTCANSLKFNPNTVESATGIKRPLTSCLNSASYSKLGNDVGNGKSYAIQMRFAKKVYLNHKKKGRRDITFMN